MADLLHLESRRRIFNFVQDHPGTHLREIARQCDMPLGTALYHLDQLEDAELVAIRRDGRYKRYFGGTGIGREEKTITSQLRRRVPRLIAKTLLVSGMATQRELCVATCTSRSTISSYLGSLAREGIVVLSQGKENLYALRNVPLVRAVMEKLGETIPSFQEAPRNSFDSGLAGTNL